VPALSRCSRGPGFCDEDENIHQRIGAHGKPVLFLHPKDFSGTLVELEQA